MILLYSKSKQRNKVVIVVCTITLLFFVTIFKSGDDIHSTKECMKPMNLSESDGRFVGASETLLMQLISVALHKFFNIHTSKPRIIVDVGANIGIFTYLLCSQFPNAHIYSFEPGNEMRIWLEKKIRKCPQPKNVRILSEAVSDADSIPVTLYGPAKQKKYSLSNLKPHNTGASISPGVNKERGSTTVLSKTFTVKLDTFFHDFSISSILLVKIDTEGLDPLVIMGMKNLLANGAVYMLYWEFGKHWKAASLYTLSSVVRTLENYSYESYVVGKQNMNKISGDCFDRDSLDAIFSTLNVFSVLANSPFSNIPTEYDLKMV